MSRGWREHFFDPYTDHDADFDAYMAMSMHYPDSDEYSDEDEDMSSDFADDQIKYNRYISEKIECRYCKDSFVKECNTCELFKTLASTKTCGLATCAKTIANHTCTLEYFCYVCQKRFSTRRELDSGGHGLKQNGVVVDCNLFTAQDTLEGDRIYSTKASQVQHKSEMAPLYEQIRKGLGLELASDAMNDQATMNPDAAVFVPGVGAHRSKSG